MAAEADSAKAGAPETEIEITPAMVAAGLDEIASYNTDFESPADAVARIYLGMAMAAPNR